MERPSELLVLAALPSLFAAATIVLGFVADRALGRRRIYAVPLREGQLRWETLATLRFWAVAIPTTWAALTFGPFEAGLGNGAIALTFGVCFFVFDVYYYFLHRAMHRHRGFFRVHRWHHESRVNTPMSSYSLSFIETLFWMLGWVAPPLLLSLFAPVSLEGFLGYLCWQAFANVLGHLNVEPFGTFFSKRFASWGAHPVIYHSLHHARYEGHLGFATTIYDRLLGTEYEDWEALHHRVVAGEALPRLQTRGAEAADERSIAA